ncbi:hypothetical protein QOZ84_12065 [Romboutsia sedimentorum]|uniref:Viral A-type inclusion protein n=1 Tax=Romboutsia sedimentorum TaxID=1368474 RepID=A0ABT7EBH2_9FIRM|nr:hypothetical protein [Romboutsia sedimentorum]MDK2564287.1 hypothetical protein [Romboutsia sedimentorum]
MNISNISSNSLFLGSYNISSLKKIQINNSTNKENTDISLKELKAINKGKHLARESLDATYNSSINKKLQESLEHKLSQLNEMKSMIENKDEKNDVVDDSIKNTKVNTYVKNTEEIKDKKETLLSEDEQISLQDIKKKISETDSELKQIKILGKQLSKQSEMIDDRISVFKKMYGNDIFKMAEKEAVLKQVYDTRNNPLIKELKSTFDEIIELETQLKDKLNKEQPEDKKEI